MIACCQSQCCMALLDASSVFPAMAACICWDAIALSVNQVQWPCAGAVRGEGCSYQEKMVAPAPYCGLLPHDADFCQRGDHMPVALARESIALWSAIACKHIIMHEHKRTTTAVDKIAESHHWPFPTLCTALDGYWVHPMIQAAFCWPPTCMYPAVVLPCGQLLPHDSLFTPACSALKVLRRVVAGRSARRGMLLLEIESSLDFPLQVIIEDTHEDALQIYWHTLRIWRKGELMELDSRLSHVMTGRSSHVSHRREHRLLLSPVIAPRSTLIVAVEIGISVQRDVGISRRKALKLDVGMHDASLILLTKAFCGELKPPGQLEIPTPIPEDGTHLTPAVDNSMLFNVIAISW
eukprot:CAMPEP_0115828698 /NCGR_PEP_ID=MMETSP0287-20121206/708_1 /TAXON_ID=412157 /ORGANISM="Chrysochromulina rotalis, Strain UIO044" /LENGTH=350 /DNA_ID=CAMNT_0003281923 /DNA_START=96 /DNA_END=1145 /DNA_ORIENTATION=-